MAASTPDPITLDAGHFQDYMPSQYNEANARIPVTDMLSVAPTVADDTIYGPHSQLPEDALQHVTPPVSISNPPYRRFMGQMVPVFSQPFLYGEKTSVKNG